MASDITRWLEGLVIRLRRWATLLWREIRMPARPVLRAINLWLDADGLRMSAAMSFYGILSLAPLVALLVSVLGRWLDMERLEANLMGRISAGLGQQAADVVQQSLGNAFTSDGTAASLLTFLVFVFSEILNRYSIHPVQYLLIGLALVLFYTLLLSLSEQIGFTGSYIVSSLAIIGLITLYSKTIFSQNKMVAVLAGILIILYGFLFIVLRSEDYALLLGSIGLFIVLAIVMYLSRKVQWYGNIDKES